MHNYSTHDKKTSYYAQIFGIIIPYQSMVVKQRDKITKNVDNFLSAKKTADNSFLGELPAVSRHNGAMNLR